MAHLEHAKSTFEPLGMPAIEPVEPKALGAYGGSWQRQWTDLTACPSDSDFGDASFDRLTTCEAGCEHEEPGALGEGVPMQRGAHSWVEEDAADRHAFRLRREDRVDYWLGLFRDADDSVLEAALKGGPGGEGADPQLWAAVDPGLALAWQGDAEDGPGRSGEAEDGDRHAFRTASSPVLAFEPPSAPGIEPTELVLLGACSDPWQRQLTHYTACPSDGDFGPAGFDRLTTCGTGCEHEGPGALDEGVPMQRGSQAWTEEDAADRHAFRLRKEVGVNYWLGLFRDADDSVLEAALKDGLAGEGRGLEELLKAVGPDLARAWQGDAEDGVHRRPAISCPAAAGRGAEHGLAGPWGGLAPRGS